MKKMKCTAVANEQGAALLLVLVMLTALLGAAGWLAMQTRTETAIVSALKDYSKAFNAADGSWWVGLYYLVNEGVADEHSTATPKAGGAEISVKSSYRNFINNRQMQDVVGSADNIESISRIRLVDTIQAPVPGESIMKSTFWYELVGEGKLNFTLSDGTDIPKASSKVSATVLRVQ